MTTAIKRVFASGLVMPDIQYSKALMWASVLLIQFFLAVFLLCTWEMSILFLLTTVVVVGVFLKPRIGFYILIILVPITAFEIRTHIFGDYLPVRFWLVDHQHLTHVVAIPTTLGALLWRGLKHSGPLDEGYYFKRRLSYGFIVLAVWAAISMLWAPVRSHALINLMQLYVNMGLFALPLIFIKDMKNARMALYFWLMAGLMFSIMNIIDRTMAYYHPVHKTKVLTTVFRLYEKIDFAFLFRRLPVRASGLATFDQNSEIMNMAIPLPFFIMLKKDFAAKAIAFGSLALLFFARALILNKAGLGGFIFSVTLLVFAYKYFKGRNLRIYLAIVLLGAAAFLISQVVFSKNVEIERLLKSSKIDGTKNSLSIRVHWWKKGIKQVASYSYLGGLGPGGFKAFVNAPHTHEFVLSFFMDFGVIGFFAIIYIMIMLATGFFTSLRSQDTDLQKMSFLFFCGLAAFFIQSLVDFEHYMMEMWLYTGTVVAVFCLSMKKSEEVSNP